MNGAVGGLFTQGGTLTGNAEVDLQANDLNNTGRIASAGLVNLAGWSLSNYNGGTIQGDLGVAINVSAASLGTNSAIESYYGPVDLAVISGLVNQGSIITNQNIVLAINGAFTNQGDIVAGNDVAIGAAGAIRNQQTVSAGRDLLVSAVDDAGNLYQIANQGGMFLAGNDARFNTSFFTNSTSGGLAEDTGWQHFAVIYPDGLHLAGKKWQGMHSGFKGRLSLELSLAMCANAGLAARGNDGLIGMIVGAVAAIVVTVLWWWSGIGLYLAGYMFGKMFPWYVLQSQFQALRFSLKAALAHSPLPAQSQRHVWTDDICSPSP